MKFRILGQLSQGNKALELSAWIESTNTGHRFPARILVDSGASGMFIDRDFAEENGITLYRLESPIPVRNADGSDNRGGPIKYDTDLWIETLAHRECARLEVTNLRRTQNVILGYPWLQHHNPNIDWSAGTLVFDKCNPDHFRI